PAMQAPFRIDPELAARCGLHAGSFRPHQYAPAVYHRERRDDGLGGALIGGAVGGLIGNRVAGRGDRTVGTIAGAAVGAVAGAAIDRSDDRGFPEPRWAEDDAGWDHRVAGAYAGECADALPAGYTVIAIPGSRECRDEVETIEEWVPEYVTVPGRAPPPRAAPLRDKRTKLRRVK
ncbi:MAG TPA: glycine zipper 2TM domain-containing protein, partial [Novosphingobium sp.]|nr:glycine zipper 2TM domain-containing protein [Novosphingobium sp.]